MKCFVACREHAGGVSTPEMLSQRGVLASNFRRALRPLFPMCRLASWVAPIILPIVLAMLLSACRKPAQDPVTLSYFRLGWSQPDELPSAVTLSQQFVQQTGIHLKNLPVGETALDQLELSRKLLASGSGLDVLGVDLIWSGVLARDLMDLQPDLAAEITSLEPRLLPSYIVDGRLVAIPHTVQIGTLEYRTDLLHKYGYDHPPRTWSELETMAERIQAGERAAGRKDFWGYVWQGSLTEALTCNALEWQASDGGGRIIEDDRTISVNNPAAGQSWERARKWVGWISPPSVLEYRELDSMNVFDSGGAAFNRVWGATTITPGQARLFHRRKTLPRSEVGYANMPGGSAGWAGTLGGSGLAVSQHSVHRQEAIELVRFLIRAEIQTSKHEDSAGQFKTGDAPPGSSPQNRSTRMKERGGVVSRPSAVAGDKYEQVARAYIDTVHSVLTGQKGATQAAAELEKELVKITGFAAGQPKPTGPG